MTVEKRMRIVRMIEKMERNEKYSEKIGLKNKSYLKQIKDNGDGKRHEIHSVRF